MKTKTVEKKDAAVVLDKGQVWLSTKFPDRTCLVLQVEEDEKGVRFAQVLTNNGVVAEKRFTIDELVKSSYKLVRTLNKAEMEEAVNEKKEEKMKETKVVKKETKAKVEGPVSQYGHRAGSNAGIIDAVLAKKKVKTIEELIELTGLNDLQVRGYLSHLRGADHKVRDFDYLTARKVEAKAAKPAAKAPAKAEKPVTKVATKVAPKAPAKAEVKKTKKG